MSERVTVGSVEQLAAAGYLTAKAGSRPVCVFLSDGEAFALDDRCPHLGFPLHRGSVEAGLVTCHWHNARFDLGSGGTLDPWADDVRAYPVSIDNGMVTVVVEADVGRRRYLERRLVDGLEQGITLVLAKAVLGLLEAGMAPEEIVGAAAAFGARHRAAGWGAGLTVATAMANLVGHLDPADVGLGLVHALVAISADTRGAPERFELPGLGPGAPLDRLAGWYRRFLQTRSAPAAERVLATAVAALDPGPVLELMTTPLTDHVLLDGGHTIDFTNKAFELLDHLGWPAATWVLGTLVAQSATASRSEEQGAWRYPLDLAALVDRACSDLGARLARAPSEGRFDGHAGVAALAGDLLESDPEAIVAAIDAAIDTGANAEQLGRAVAYAAAVRVARFHTQNDHGDWDQVHHSFTAANALHGLLVRGPTPELLRGVYHLALRVHLDRFLNIPAARVPDGAEGGRLSELQYCWDHQGQVEQAAAIVAGELASGVDPARIIAALGRALLDEDAGFHWFQLYEAAVRQFTAWPPGSAEGRVILVGLTRFLAAHTPTRRELSQVVRIASRLGRGEAVFAED